MTARRDSGPMYGSERALSLLEDALKGSPADETELVLLASRTAVTRFANSTIHQNVEQVDRRIAVRVVVGKSVARLFTNSDDPAEIRDTIGRAVALARLLPANPDFRSLPSTGEGYPPPVEAPVCYFDATANLSPEDRAQAVGRVFDAAASAGLVAFGTYSSAVTELGVASTAGIRSHATVTRAYLKALVEGAHGTGFGDALGRDAATIDADDVARQAVEKCRANREQAELDPGDYEAVFDANAVADMARFPVTTGCGARQVLDGESFMSGKVGERVGSEAINLWDDPADARCLPMPIDYEGLPSVRVELVRDGVAAGPVYDAQTAFEAGTRSTGHAVSPFDDFPSGPEASHIVMFEGTATTQELISRVKHGVWVTRFHYTGCPDRKRVIATGTTRDGTFLIRDGEVVGALKNLRFEMGALDLFSSLQEAGKGKLCQDWWAANGMDVTNYFVPAMRFGTCHFSGVTTF